MNKDDIIKNNIEVEKKINNILNSVELSIESKIIEINNLKNNNSYFVIIKNKIYDIIFIIQNHPAGNKAIFNKNGNDIYNDYKFHSKKTKKLIKKKYVGKLI